MRREYGGFVYMMTNASRRSIYTGTARDLERRVFEHKNHQFAGFTDKYNCTRLVYFETFSDFRSVIDREKQIKRWRREKKVALIEGVNPTWKDLAVEWGKPQGPSTRSPWRPRSG
jgi:putative endonuclease